MSSTSSPVYSLQTLIPIILLTLLTLRALRNRLRPVLRTLPGPTLAAYTSLWRLYSVRRGDAHLTAIALHRKHGPLVRIGPNHISVSDPREISNIYSLKGGFTKTAFYPIQCISWQQKPQMNLFSARDEAFHREQRRPVANAFGLASLLAKEDALDSCSRLFVERLGSLAEKGLSVDLGAWLQYYAFDCIGELSFARKLGFLEQGMDVDGMIGALQGMLKYASQCGQIPEWHPFLLGNPLFPILLPSMETWNQVLNFTLKVMNDITPSLSIKRDGELDIEALDAKGDMLSRWSAIKISSPEKMSTRDIIVHLSTNVFAGSDTTAIALRAVVYFLLKNPGKMQKLMAQIDEADREGRLSDPIQYKEAVTHLPYLDAVLKEAMRLHPSVGLLLERHVPPGGAVICGVHVPAGTVVGINAWVTQHDPDIYPEPEKFIPERWIVSGEERLKLMEQSFFAFGAGSRTCLGKHISLLEMTKIIPQLLRDFEFKLAKGYEKWKVTNRWFVQQEGLICDLVKRR